MKAALNKCPQSSETKIYTCIFIYIPYIWFRRDCVHHMEPFSDSLWRSNPLSDGRYNSTNRTSPLKFCLRPVVCPISQWQGSYKTLPGCSSAYRPFFFLTVVQCWLLTMISLSNLGAISILCRTIILFESLSIVFPLKSGHAFRLPQQLKMPAPISKSPTERLYHPLWEPLGNAALSIVMHHLLFDDDVELSIELSPLHWKVHESCTDPRQVLFCCFLILETGLDPLWILNRYLHQVHENTT